MADTQKFLEQPGFRQSSSATQPDRTLGDAISTIGGMVANEVVDRRVQTINGAFDNANRNISEQEDAFNATQKSILDGLVDADSKARVEQYIGAYDKLHAGEFQGTLSPAEASVRREMLYRKFAGAYPVLKSTFKEVTDMYQKGSKVGAADDPIAKARAQLIEKSVTMGLPVPTIIEREQFKANLELAQQRGQASFAGVQSRWNGVAGQAMLAIDERMREEITRTGGLDAIRWKRDLVQEREKVIRSLNAETLSWSQESNFMLTPENYNDLQNDVKNAFDALITAADAGDLQSVLDRGIKIQQAKGIEYYIRNFGPVGALIPMMGVHGFQFLNETVPKMFENMGKHGNMDVIRKLAATGDSDAVLFTSMLDSGAFEGGRYVSSFMRSLGSKEGGAPALSNNKHEQSMFDSMAFAAVETLSRIKNGVQGNVTKPSPEQLLKVDATLAGANKTIFRANVPVETLVAVGKSPHYRKALRETPAMQEGFKDFINKSSPELFSLMSSATGTFRSRFNPNPTRKDNNGLPDYFTYEPWNTYAEKPFPVSQTLDTASRVFGQGEEWVDGLYHRLNAIYHNYRIVDEQGAQRWAMDMLAPELRATRSTREPVEITELPENATVEDAEAFLKANGIE